VSFDGDLEAAAHLLSVCIRLEADPVLTLIEIGLAQEVPRSEETQFNILAVACTHTVHVVLTTRVRHRDRRFLWHVEFLTRVVQER
jgi:hypothetical protein